MDSKVGGLSSKWNSLLNKGATIAKESLEYVNKQITDNINKGPSENSSYSDPTSIQTSDPIGIAISKGQIPVFYELQSSYCPTQCSTCQNRNHSDDAVYVFLLPPENVFHQITPARLKQLLPASIKSNSIYLRFKILPQQQEDLFTDFVWLDIPEDAVVPLFNGAIHTKILQIPPHYSIEPLLITSALDSSHRTTDPGFSSSRTDFGNKFSNNPSSSNPLKNVDFLNTPLKDNSSSISQSTPLDLTEFDRASLISQREAKKEARIQEVLNQRAGGSLWHTNLE